MAAQAKSTSLRGAEDGRHGGFHDNETKACLMKLNIGTLPTPRLSPVFHNSVMASK